jgi:hypothetical protein
VRVSGSTAGMDLAIAVRHDGPCPMMATALVRRHLLREPESQWSRCWHV